MVELNFETIPEKHQGVVMVPEVIVTSDETIGQAFMTIMPNVIGKKPPQGKIFRLQLSIVGYVEDEPT